MTQAAQWALLPALPLVAAVLWVAMAWPLPRLPGRMRRRLGWGLALAGVPVLGLLTLNWGPGLGVAGLGIGLALLVWRQGVRPVTGGPS